MVGPPCCRPAGELLAYLKAAERNILPHHRLGEAASSPGPSGDLGSPADPGRVPRPRRRPVDRPAPGLIPLPHQGPDLPSSPPLSPPSPHPHPSPPVLPF